MPPTIFVSYTQSDVRWKEALVRQIGVLQLEGLVEAWHDGLIPPGTDWLPMIESAMAEARVAVLIVSAEFLTSAFIQRKEIPALLERRHRQGLPIIPVIARPCQWQKVSWLAAMQARPHKGKTLADLRGVKAEKVLSDLAEEILQAMEITASAHSKTADIRNEDQRPESPALATTVLSSAPTNEKTTPMPVTAAEASVIAVTAEQLRVTVPELNRLLDSTGNELYASVTIRKPGAASPVQGFWADHLDLLREQGKIHGWSSIEGGALRIAVQQGDHLWQALLAEVEVLSRTTIGIVECRPFDQAPVPGSTTRAGDVRYPDLPIRADYLDLVLTPEGKSAWELLLENLPLTPLIRPPIVRRENDGQLEILWSLCLRGRRHPMHFKIHVDAHFGEAYNHWAHLMVWPRFRDVERRWRAYYFYGRCFDVRIAYDVIYSRAGSDSAAGPDLFRRRAERQHAAGPFPVSFQCRPSPRHDGGAPLAVALRRLDNDQELGLYLVPLEPIPNFDATIEVAVDFGSSRTVAAFRAQGESRAHLLELAPELDPAAARLALTLHLCENATHVEAPQEKAGLLANAAWLPSYRKVHGEAALPSELLMNGFVYAMAPLTDWQPIRDFTIPPFDLSREDLSEFLLTDFKQPSGSEHFRDLSQELSSRYLALYLELILAEIAGNHLRGFPAKPIQFTFTYPASANAPPLAALQDSMRAAVDQSVASLGIAAGEIGYFDELRSATLATCGLGEVCVVGDLGGRALQLFITANHDSIQPLREVSDSVEIGGNRLLDAIAGHPAEYLPGNGRWFGPGIDPRDTAAKLRQWILNKGSSSPWNAGERETFKFNWMSLAGFSTLTEGRAARQLIDRYFRLVVEYIARSLVAFLVYEWYPKVAPSMHPHLRIAVRLRGNGWRLRYQFESHLQTNRAIQDLVRKRLAALWPLALANDYPAPLADSHWDDPGCHAIDDPQTESIRSVVGKRINTEEVAKRAYTHTLTEVEVRRKDGRHVSVPWTASVPFFTDESRQVYITKLAPPLPLTDEEADEQVEISYLRASELGRINDGLRQAAVVNLDDGTVRAPVAALVWEAIFERVLKS